MARNFHTAAFPYYGLFPVRRRGLSTLSVSTRRQTRTMQTSHSTFVPEKARWR